MSITTDDDLDLDDEACRNPACDGSLDDGNGWNGFCGDCADRYFGRTCGICGETMTVDRETGKTHHTDEDGEIDERADASHAPVDEDDMDSEV